MKNNKNYTARSDNFQWWVGGKIKNQIVGVDWGKNQVGNGVCMNVFGSVCINLDNFPSNFVVLGWIT